MLIDPMPIATVNPATGETVKVFNPHTAAEVEERLALAASAFQAFRKVPLAERCALLERTAMVFEQKREQLAAVLTLEMGKLRAAALAEVDKSATCLHHYAAEAPRYLQGEEIKTDALRSYLRHDPLGPVLAVMPWNFPYWQVIRFAAPALAAGNVGLLKHASSVPQAALALEAAFAEAGAPPGVFQTLLIEGSRTSALLDDPRVAAATLTGSEGAGRALAEAAGRNLKKVVLELGGSDPFLVLPSADLEKAAQVAVTARVQNAGQSCIAAKRFIVHEQVWDTFLALFVGRLQKLKVGRPSDAATELGPLASASTREEVDAQVQRTLQMGGRLLCGGHRLPGPGYYYAATAIADAPRGSPARDEELFGPVATLIKVASLEEAIAVANETRFGLGAAAFTRDPAEQQELAAALEAGCVFFNGLVKSDPRLPFGGIKASGFGRELAGQGLREFVNVKTVWVGG
jgi:succinate-semialdehyde dehydrogenase / glutarate-semialdehyde dehydrogenase